MARKRVKLSFNQYFAINVLRKKGSIKLPASEYFHQATIKSLIKNGIFKSEKGFISLNTKFKFGL